MTRSPGNGVNGTPVTPAPTFEDPLRTLCNYDIVLTTG